MERRRIRIFLASPRDTAEARQVVVQTIHAVASDPAYRHRVEIDLRRWDDPERPVPVSFRRNPQADVVEYVGDPADCDLVIGLFRHVFGSPLPEQDEGHHYGLSPDGDPWTGTEWELHRADAPGSRVREVWVFRDKTLWQEEDGWDDEESARRWEQNRRVRKFFKDCKRPQPDRSCAASTTTRAAPIWRRSSTNGCANGSSRCWIPNPAPPNPTARNR